MEEPLLRRPAYHIRIGGVITCRVLLTDRAGAPPWRGGCQIDIIAVELGSIKGGGIQSSLSILTGNNLILDRKSVVSLRKGRSRNRSKGDDC